VHSCSVCLLFASSVPPARAKPRRRARAMSLFLARLIEANMLDEQVGGSSSQVAGIAESVANSPPKSGLRRMTETPDDE